LGREPAIKKESKFYFMFGFKWTRIPLSSQGLYSKLGVILSLCNMHGAGQDIPKGPVPDQMDGWGISSKNFKTVYLEFWIQRVGISTYSLIYFILLLTKIY